MSVLPVGFSSSSGGYQIDNSLRFDGTDDYLSRTFGTPTSNTTWSFSCWVKRSKLATTSQLFGRTGGLGAIGFESTDIIRFWTNAGGVAADSTSLYRDPAAHGHFFVRSNGTNIKGYWNGVEVISYTGTINNINYSGIVHDIGRAGTYYSSGYLSDIYFIDGQALTPSDFAETNADGVWVPKAYTGTYGDNGFHLDFATGTNTTTLGYDVSGNTNHWTLSGMTRSAGVNECWMTDTPTNNYATLNSLMLGGAGVDTANGLLYANRNSSGYARIAATQGVSSGKWYFEWLPNNNVTSQNVGVGQVNTSANFPGYESTSWGYETSTGNKVTNNSGSAYGSAYSGTDPIGVALDMDNGKIWFSRNGTFEASGDPAAGTNAAFTTLSGTVFPMVGLSGISTNGNINFGQRDFTYTPPSGFQALCTDNLPAVAIVDPLDYYAVKTYTGSAGSQSFTTDSNSRALPQVDFGWIKHRGAGGGQDHQLFDVLRSENLPLISNSTAQEGSAVTGFSLDASGFTVPANTSKVSTTGETYAAWLWKANGAGVTNTDGNIHTLNGGTSTIVSANQTAGFSIVTYMGCGSNATVGHGLGVAPKMVIVKDKSAGTTNDWRVWHSGLTGGNNELRLNTAAGQATDVTTFNPVPTSTVLGFGSNTAVNGNLRETVAYCFAEIPGYSKFGSYTGNGSTDGPFVYCGFRPRWVLFKNVSASANWVLVDTARDTYNLMDAELMPNRAYVENYSGITTWCNIDAIANGFKVRYSSPENNGSGNTIIFAAFAEHPFGGSNVSPSPAR